MKPNLPTLIVLLLVTCFSSYAQSSQKFSYLIVNINKSQDKEPNRDYYEIDAEKDNPNAASIYALARYSNKASKNAMNADNQPYNYFKSIGEVLNFLDSQGWQLLSVYNHIYTNVYEKVRSEPVYYLRKEIINTTAGDQTSHP